MGDLNHENKVLEVKLKEKEQEVKLNELKIRELRKQVPNSRLRPLGNTRSKSISQSNAPSLYSGQSRLPAAQPFSPNRGNEKRF